MRRDSAHPPAPPPRSSAMSRTRSARLSLLPRHRLTPTESKKSLPNLHPSVPTQLDTNPTRHAAPSTCPPRTTPRSVQISRPSTAADSATTTSTAVSPVLATKPLAQQDAEELQRAVAEARQARELIEARSEHTRQLQAALTAALAQMNKIEEEFTRFRAAADTDRIRYEDVIKENQTLRQQLGQVLPVTKQNACVQERPQAATQTTPCSTSSTAATDSSSVHCKRAPQPSASPSTAPPCRPLLSSCPNQLADTMDSRMSAISSASSASSVPVTTACSGNTRSASLSTSEQTKVTSIESDPMGFVATSSVKLRRRTTLSALDSNSLSARRHYPSMQRFDPVPAKDALQQRVARSASSTISSSAGQDTNTRSVTMSKPYTNSVTTATPSVTSTTCAHFKEDFKASVASFSTEEKDLVSKENHPHKFGDEHGTLELKADGHKEDEKIDSVQMEPPKPFERALSLRLLHREPPPRRMPNDYLSDTSFSIVTPVSSAGSSAGSTEHENRTQPEGYVHRGKKLATSTAVPQKGIGEDPNLSGDRMDRLCQVERTGEAGARAYGVSRNRPAAQVNSARRQRISRRWSTCFAFRAGETTTR